MSKTFVNKESYEKLISEDIERLESEMENSPEKAHIKTVLEWSVGVIYGDHIKAVGTSGNPLFPLERIKK